MANIIDEGLIAEDRIEPEPKSLSALVLSNSFINFKPIFKQADKYLTFEQILNLLVKVDEVADKAYNLSRNGIVLEVTIGFITLN